MLDALLRQNKSKTLEFEENTQSLQKIIHTLIAFANTAGGTLLIGIKGENKEVVGLEDVRLEEERIANAVADSVFPFLAPKFQFYSHRGQDGKLRDILIVSVSQSAGPFYLKAKGESDSVYVRLGSTNCIADASMIADINLLKQDRSFDELPDCRYKPSDLDLGLARKLFEALGKKFTDATALSLGLVTRYQSELYPTYGALLLFGKDRDLLFPSPLVQLIRFEGNTKSSASDCLEINSPLPIALNEILYFLRRNTRLRVQVKDILREEIPEYPAVAVREAVVNMLIHADYATMNSVPQVAIFDDRMELTNPGGLPIGLDLEKAISGISQPRNKLIGRIFKDLKLAEQWGSGLFHIIEACQKEGTPPPKFEDLGRIFRVTLYPRVESEKKEEKESFSLNTKKESKPSFQSLAKRARHALKRFILRYF